MKKFTQVAVAAGVAVALSSSVFAGGYSRAEMPAEHCGVHGFGVSLMSLVGDSDTARDGAGAGSRGLGFIDWGHDLFFGVNYITNPWEMGLQFNATNTRNDVTAHHTALYTLFAHAGYRWALYHCLFGSVGLNGGWHHNHNNGSDRSDSSVTTNRYNVGAYLGMSYEPTEHFQVFTRVDAVSYQWGRNTSNDRDLSKVWNFFDQAEFGLAYYFGDLV